ncbi:MAG: hypothetical protein GVY18_10385 [Bacteroidetes bacterium]|nr:hypothetical protein [Bacteroidota bacterium]
MIRLAFLCALVALTGCFSLSRDEPPQQHYVLGGTPLPETDASAERLAGLAIGLRQPQLAEYLETPFIVVRQGPHQLRFSEFHRWGEELAGGINRTVAAHLAARGSLDGIDVVPWAPRARHDYLIQLHLLRFEGLAPEVPTASEGAAYLLATWEIIDQQDGAVLARGTTDYRADGWTVGDYDELVALLDTGLRELSDDLIAALERHVAP